MNSSDIIYYLDWLLAPFYLLIIYIIAVHVKNISIKEKPIYKYFLAGLFFKIFGAVSLCLVYVYYYKEGGDTLAYHSASLAFVNLLFQDPYVFFKVWLGPSTAENYFFFNQDTGYPVFYFQRYEVFVSKLLVPLELLSFKRYVITSIFMAVISYSGIWRLYVMFCEIYPALYKKFSIAILFIPSVVFWGSGILKDSWTIAAACWFCYSFYKIFIIKSRVLYYSFLITIASFVLIGIKPYIFIALMPGCLIWGVWDKIWGIRNIFFRIVSIPIVLCFGIGAGYFLWNMVSSNLGQYSSLDSMIKKAYVSSEDLKQDYYQGNSFDLGSYEPTFAGIMSKFPIAVMTGLFRPFIFEAKNIVMIMSGIENLLILFFSLYVFWQNPFFRIKNFNARPLVLFSLIFALFFAFSVAVSTSNFGALVRLRIPLMPFFLAALVIIEYEGKKRRI